MSEWIIKDDYMTCPVCTSKFFKIIPVPKECPRCLTNLESEYKDKEFVELTPVFCEFRK